MARAFIIEGGIDDSFWPKIILAMTYVKNLRPTKALQGLSPYQELFKTLPNLAHLRVLGSIVYVLIHEEEREFKSEKFVPRALKGKLVGFDGHTIYRVHIEEQNRVIRVKDLRIFEDIEIKENTLLPSYENEPTFQGFLLEDNDDKKGAPPVISPAAPPNKEGTPVTIIPAPTPTTITSRTGRVVKPTPKAKDTYTTTVATSSSSCAGRKVKSTEVGQKVKDTEDASSLCRGQKVEDSRDAGLMVKNTMDATAPISRRDQEVENTESARQTSKKTSQTETQELIVQLTELLKLNWENNKAVAMATHKQEHVEANDWQPTQSNDEEEDPIKILAARMCATNATNVDHFVCSTQFDVEEPETYTRAMQGPNAPQWTQAMTEELDQLYKNDTWKLVPRDEIELSHRPLGGKWVYKVKQDVDGNIARFKARWVVKGYLQQFGVDFDQKFAAVVKPMAFRVLFAIATYFDLDIDQMDVKTAFLYGLINQLIYVEMPKWTKTKANKNMVCKLLKALYGLKQSPRLWYKRLSAFLLEKLGLRRTHANYSIFITKAGLNGPIVSTFVDDIKIMRTKGSGFIGKVKAELTAAFSIVDMGSISFYLGLKVTRDREKKTIKLLQPAYINKVLEKFHLSGANTANCPMKESTLLTQRTEGEGEASPSEKEKYQGMTGSLMFSMVETRPDIAYAMSLVSRFAKNPSHQHTKAVKTIL